MQTSHLSGTGKREHNEDSYLQLADRQIYIVCDGVGGSAKGEVASRLCCDSFKDYFSKNKGSVTEESIQEAISVVEKAFDVYLDKHPEATGMGTTLAFLSVGEDKAIVAHAGDSRVYHIRDGKILFVTKDHSLVNDLLASGFIKPEQAANHPKKNQITKAIQGSTMAVKADINHLTGIMPGDFLFLCSDGILESVSPQFIEEEFREMNEPEGLKNKIAALCAANSRDNYTCIIVKAGKLAETVKGKNVIGSNAKAPAKAKRKNKFMWMLLVVILIAAGYFAYAEWKKRNEAVTEKKPVKKAKEPPEIRKENTPDKIKDASPLKPVMAGDDIPADQNKRSGPNVNQENEMVKEKEKEKSKTPAKEIIIDRQNTGKVKPVVQVDTKTVIQTDSLDTGGKKDSLQLQ